MLILIGEVLYPKYEGCLNINWFYRRIIVNNYSKQNTRLHILISCLTRYVPYFTHTTNPNE